MPSCWREFEVSAHGLPLMSFSIEHLYSVSSADGRHRKATCSYLGFQIAGLRHTCTKFLDIVLLEQKQQHSHAHERERVQLV
jgi:hypothetical protein